LVRVILGHRVYQRQSHTSIGLTTEIRRAWHDGPVSPRAQTREPGRWFQGLSKPAEGAPPRTPIGRLCRVRRLSGESFNRASAQSYRIVFALICKLNDLLCDHIGCGIGAVDQVKSAQCAFKGLGHDGDLIWPKRSALQKTTEWHDEPPVVPRDLTVGSMVVRHTPVSRWASSEYGLVLQIRHRDNLRAPPTASRKKYPPSRALAHCLRCVSLFRDDVHALEALRVDRFLHHAGLFCFVDECRE